MSRILLLLIFMIWIAWYPSLADPQVSLNMGFGIFLGGYIAVILALGLWSRWASGRISSGNFHRFMSRFNKMMGAGRVFVPAWLAAGMYFFHWHDVVQQTLGLLKGSGELGSLLRLPDIFAGTLPAFLAWAGLWWSQYPADRALREQNALLQLEHDIPVHAPPTFWNYFGANLRLQLLFIFAPIFLLIGVRDLAIAINFALFHQPMSDVAEFVVMICSFAGVFIFAPTILTRVLKTESLPSSALRLRLEEMSRRHGLRYRDILLWHTQGSVGNAAVMGVLPRLRYVLLSDLLLETMPDEQIEAVFAHELGHIVHRHLIWYIIFIVTLLLALSGPGGKAFDYLTSKFVNDPDAHQKLIEIISCIATATAFALFFILFGYVSRRFERQADVFASRTLDETAGGRRTPVGPKGAAVFSAALHRIAVVNNIPIATRSWCHGSIEKRMRYVRKLAEGPEHTARFDQVMSRLYVILIAALIVSAIGVAMVGMD
ncbi:MAG TPA: M48 family metallopeptidase [Tepidisphaeraceae bacterium]|jgi:STE24 endopeptidase